MATIHFLNVDEGDCSIIQHEDDKVTMIDVCCAHQHAIVEKAFTGNVLQPIRGNFRQKDNPENPLSYLQMLGVKSIFRYIQTHPDMDHMDGLNSISRNFKIYNFWDTANTKELEFSKPCKYNEEDWNCYQKLRKSKDNPKALVLYSGQKNRYYASDDKGLKTDDYLEILSPTKDLIRAANQAKEWNDSSYVILYNIQGRKILFCGDAGDSTFEHLLKNYRTKISNIDVLIAPHHGRRAQINDYSFLTVMKPKLTLFGNAGNGYLAYEKYRPHLINNDCGNILLEINNGRIYVYVSNKIYATKEIMAQHKQLTHRHPTLDAWLISKF